MSLVDAIQQAIDKSGNTPQPTATKAPMPEPDKVADSVEEVVDEVEEEEIETASDDLEDEDEVDDEDESEDEEEEALSAKFKEEKKTKEVKEPIRVERIIEDGVEREITIEELKKGYQKASVSGKRFEEAARIKTEAMQLQNEVQDFVELFEENPILAGYEVLGQERMNAFLTQYRREMDAFDAMSDVEKENFILKKNQQMGEMKRQFRNAKQNESLTEEEAKALKISLSEKVNKVVTEAGFTTNEMKLRLLNKMKSYAKQKPGNQPLDLAEIEMLADRVKDEARGEFSKIVSSMNEEELLEYLGSEVVEKVRKKLVEKYKTKKAQKVEPTKKVETKKISNNGPKSKMDYEAFWKNPT